VRIEDRSVRSMGLQALVIAGMAILAFVVFHAWGLRGSLALIALWGVSYAGFFLWRRRTQRLIRERFASMTGRQRAEALFSLSEADRAEVLDAVKRNEG
jgi:hypothetical protein